ncbi:tRNA glutamyl-Q(34) synthetase GluQRS [Phenylobacterium sp.]|uniref:tRNA glutamyl-Q(34) synthetase GluQRS n=1 Tax=Phenylobacterium sp. TaxID=1871053 RepID=UPI00286C12DF|nr:tRNA glutamyl-Q(34) synthetase GluQRS [Phenylobacterium sp.]
MTGPIFVTRFAPSPTGFLHRGHAYSALTAFVAAQLARGRFLLRIEDLDRTRCRPEFVTAIEEDLAWIGTAWDQPVRRQSHHLDAYSAALASLEAKGLLYRCFKTRSDLESQIAGAPHGAMDAYRGAPLPATEEARRVSAGEPYAWRLSLAAAERALGGFAGLTFAVEGEGFVQARPQLGGDVVLARKDGAMAYHLACVVDDALQGVTHVIRGVDLAEAAHVQRLLQALLDLPTPVYRHHRLLTGPDGKRLAKRDRAETLRDLRGRGMTAAELRGEMGFD